MVNCKGCGKFLKLSRASEDRKQAQLCIKCFKTGGGVVSKDATMVTSQDVNSASPSTSFDDLKVEAVFTTPTEQPAQPEKVEVKIEKGKVKAPELSPIIFKPIYLLSNKYFEKWGVEKMDNSEINACGQSWCNLFNYILPDLAKNHPVVLIVLGMGMTHIPYTIRFVQAYSVKKKKKKKGKYKEPTKEEIDNDIAEVLDVVKEEAKEEIIKNQKFPAFDSLIEKEKKNV